jgi:two-component system cell cycle response regulator
MRRGSNAAELFRRGAIPAAIAAFTLLLCYGSFAAPAHGGPGFGRIASWLCLLAAVLACGFRTVRFRMRSGRADRTQPMHWSAETALLLGVAAQALAQLTGGLKSPLQPLAYLVGAGVMIALPLALGAPLVAALILLDVLLFAAAHALKGQWPLLLAHSAFMILFAALYHALLAARLWRAGRAERNAVRRRVADAEERARELRLVATAESRSAPAMPDEVEGKEGLLTALERETLAAVAEMDSALKGALTVAEAALHPHTVAVFLCSPDGATMKLRECVSTSDRVFLGPLSVREGALGAVIASGRNVRLDNDGPALSYYEGKAPVGCFLGARLLVRPADPFLDSDASPPPVSQANDILGVLVADRSTPFTSGEERAFAAMAREVARAIESEKLLFSVRREKEEKARFFRALEALNRTSSATDAAQAAVVHARALCSTLDLCAVTLREGGDGAVPSYPPNLPKGAPLRSRGASRARHRILAVQGEGAASLQGLTFADNPGLVSNVVRLGAPLPGRDLGAMDRVVIFDGGTVVRGLAALKIFPLRAGDSVVGTLVCGSRQKTGLPLAAQGELQMLALQAAEALVRARLFEETARMATTDGLTGLLNRRALDEMLRARFAEAVRYKRPLAFVLFDIDHFKKVNDQHGHLAGDAVLRGVAREAAAQARNIDRVARYGGEELALVLPETELSGAMVIAERIRAAVAASEHAIETGSVRVTVSAGVSVLGPGLDNLEQLVEQADQALYRAKQSGRNRVVSSRESRAA